MNKYIKEIEEIKLFSNLINEHIEKNGLNSVLEKLCNKLWNEKEPSIEKKLRLKYIIGNISLYENYHYKHDILCYIIEALNTEELNLYPENLPRKNLLSSSSIREYDIIKNGQNILKHNVSFNEFFDGGSDDFALYNISLPEGRVISFATLKDDEEFSPAFGFCISENTNSLKFRPISARKFTISNYEEIIDNAVKDKKLRKLDKNKEEMIWQPLREEAKKNARSIMTKHMSIVIIDTQCANLSSVKFAFERLGYSAEITNDLNKIKSADKLILPGVGTAKAAMLNLQRLGLIEVIQNLTQPMLGICLGMQLMTAFSAEGNVSTLGLMNGQTELIPDTGLPLPHMGWNRVHFDENCPLFDGIAQDSHFYFVHSYAVLPNENTIATSHYGVDFSAAIAHDNFYGVQFHPERSGKNGALLLKNFVEKVK